MTDRHKILVVRVGRAGDMVMITPALGAIFESYPEAELHLMTSEEGRRVMKGYHPRLTRTWLYHRRFPQNIGLRRRLIHDLRNQHYTGIYVFESDTHYHRLVKGIASGSFRLDDSSVGTHFCTRCVDLVERSTGKRVARRAVSLPVSEDGLAKARALLTKNGIGPDTLLVGLHPTFHGSSLPIFRDRTGARHRVWPKESFACLARSIADEAHAMGLQLRIVIDALPEEKALVEPIVAQSGGFVTLLAEPPDFERYKGLLRSLDVLVTSNTGPMHIAAAVGTRIVALFSRWTADECGPFVPADQFRAIQAEEHGSVGRGLAAIPPGKVSEAVFDLLHVRHDVSSKDRPVSGANSLDTYSGRCGDVRST